MLIVGVAATSSEAHSYGLNFMGELCAQTNAMYVYHTLYMYAPPPPTFLQSLDLPLFNLHVFVGVFLLKNIALMANIAT